MRKVSAIPVLLPAILLFAATWAGIPAMADEQAAARQYRVARRLAAERSPDAATALRKVVDLAPLGPLADDALVEQGILAGAPGWPADLGLLTGGGMARAAALMRTVTEEYPSGDRIHEARYRAALLKMEPVVGQDLSAARLDLLTVANDPAAGLWAARARYVSTWIDRVNGHEARARTSLERLRIDYPATAEGALARIGLAQMILQDGDYGEAAALLQENESMLSRSPITSRVPEAGRLNGAAIRAVATRSFRMGLAGDRRWNLSADSFPATGIRNADGLAVDSGSGTLLSDRKAGIVVLYDEQRGKQGQWDIPGPVAVAVDRLGRIWVAGDAGLVMIRNGVAETVADLGAFASPRAIACDTLGSIWLLDRKGTRIGRLRPGTTRLESVWQGEDRLSSIVWDGRRMLALDTRGRRVVEIREENQLKTVVAGTFEKPVALASDLLGRFAVLDDRTKRVTLFGGDGVELGGYALGAAGPSRTEGLVMYPGGGIAVTGSTGPTVYRFR
ncbi:MAG: hypothetical protein IFK94_01890 [Acidobacteria bacterium]|uniref:Uncharacterized protein n=1 Tax=Candidatus Polarisedimenticola svalbardensis TaxID=2886004 RepID=A0A8J6XYR4_9BACT|nr:hypothetical protein [Candidatus Polarisedimenticola svalbardensis]